MPERCQSGLERCQSGVGAVSERCQSGARAAPVAVMCGRGVVTRGQCGCPVGVRMPAGAERVGGTDGRGT